MIYRVIREIEEGISEQFSVNLFLANQSGKLAWINNNMLKLSGVSDFSKIKGTHVRQFGEKAWKTTLKVINTRKRETLYEERDGKMFYVIKVPYTKSGFRGVLGFSIDVTELEQAKRMKAEFIMNMNHDTRTPFCGIIGVLELLYAKEKNPEKKELLKISLLSSKQLLNFMNDVNEVSQLGHVPLDYQTFDIAQMADDIVLFLEAAIKSKDLRLIKNYAGKTVCSNAFRCKHILLNLLGNAIKFTGTGEIRLAISTTPNLVISVQDTGIGVHKTFHEKIFEECFKVKPSYITNDYSGVGKGLYLVKKYTEELQGRVTVQSAVNEGAKFIVEIPLMIIAH